jgi:D-amino peptidase
VKFFVSADMEGIGGITSWDEYEKDYARCRRLFTAEVKAVCEGILASGRKVDRIVACDAHGPGQNLMIEELPDVVLLSRGSGRPLMMMDGIDATFDLAFFVGYHSGVGTRASLMDHTYSSRSFHRVRVNSVEMDEAMINAAVAGHFGVPVGFISGDDKLTRRARSEFGPGILTVTTKYAASRFAAITRHPDRILKELRAKAARAAARAREFKPYRLGKRRPVRLQLEMADTVRADTVALAPGAERVDGRTIVFRAANMLELYQTLRLAAVLALAGGTYL